MAKTVVGLFDSRFEAENAMHDLENAGFSADRISIIASGAGQTGVPAATGLAQARTPAVTLSGQMAHEEAVERTVSRDAATFREPDSGALDAVTRDAEIGAGGGAVVGGVLGLLAGLGTLLIPGVGPVLGAGPLIGLIAGGAVVGGAAGLATGGFVGALTSLGLTEAAAVRYQQYLRQGGTIVAVNVEEDRVNAAEDALRRHRAFEIEVRPLATMPAMVVPPRSASHQPIAEGVGTERGGVTAVQYAHGEVVATNSAAAAGDTAGTTPNTVAATTGGTAGLRPGRAIPSGNPLEPVSGPRSSAGPENSGMAPGPNTGVPAIVPADVASSEPAWVSRAHEQTPEEGDAVTGVPREAATTDDDTMDTGREPDVSGVRPAA